jgi:glycosyltransferase involved in cell wall biosynthesis
MDTITVIVPTYNEESTIRLAIQRIIKCEFISQIIIVDDGSTDQSLEIMKNFSKIDSRIFLIQHSNNLGKGAAIINALKEVKCDIVAIQDADLEYDPSELKKLSEFIREDIADVVYGSRFLTTQQTQPFMFWYAIGNKCLTFLVNLTTNLNLSDMETCQKVFKLKDIKKIQLHEKRFAIEPELTIKLARLGARFHEIGISYNGRSFDEGKKINWKDGVSAFYCIFKYSFMPKKLWIKI